MEVSRRLFLTGAASAAASGLAGFSSSAFAAPTPGLLRTPSKWDMTTDVLVAGSGIAGMCAAAAAVDKGAKVIVLEKGKYYSSTAASWLFKAERNGSENTALKTLRLACTPI